MSEHKALRLARTRGSSPDRPTDPRVETSRGAMATRLSLFAKGSNATAVLARPYLPSSGFLYVL